MTADRETFVFDDGEWNDESAEGVVAVVRSEPFTARELLKTLARQLHFPDYFGGNWDALEECLLDLLPNQGRPVTIRHESIPSGLNERQLRTYVNVLRFVGEERAERGDPPLVAVFPNKDRGAVLKLLGAP